jgi:hypothetical protein
MVGCPFPKESDGDLDPRGRVLHLHRTSSHFWVKLADKRTSHYLTRRMGKRFMAHKVSRIK